MSRLPKKITEHNIVKNFLVVVAIEHGRGPKFDTVRKMKFCRKINILYTNDINHGYIYDHI